VADRVLPGTPLSQTDPATVNPQALFAPLAMMRDQPAPLPGMPSVLDWLRARLEDDNLTDLRPGTTVAPTSERKAALDLLTDLARDHVPGLCHGDASSGNIIANGPHHWMYIDPRGIAGEHTYDVAVLAIRINAVRSSADLFKRIADLAQVPNERLRAWTVVAHAARV
jgi:streptomycin 6-kinase